MKSITYLFIAVFFLGACSSDPLDVNVSEIDLSLSFVDLDSIIVNTSSEELVAKNKWLKNEISEVYDYNIGYCIQIGRVSDTAFVNAINDFRSDTSILNLETQIATTFPDKFNMNQQILNGFKHLKYHFPKQIFPTHIVYMNSLFNSSIFCTDKEVGIGLERYLGADNSFVKQLNSMVYHEWIKKGMNKEFLERDAITGWLETHFVAEVDGNLAEKIIRWGKIIYFTEAALPDMDKHIIMRYSKEQLNWAYENEFSFWDYIVGEDMLFKLNERNNANMLAPGPKTPGLPKEGSPDRMGQFLGWQMVKSYMDKNDISLAELAEMKYNKILQAYEVD